MPGPIRPPKTFWHPLSLQQLSTGQFVTVVNNILSGRVMLLTQSLQESSSPSTRTLRRNSRV